MKIAVAAGGTGGHLFPALALCESIRDDDPSMTVILFKTPRDDDYYSDWDMPVVTLHAIGFPGKNPLKILSFAWQMTRALIISIRILKKEKPAVVIGFGGYISFAPLMAAKLLGIAYCIQEQNSLPGKVNKLLASGAQRIFAGLTGCEKYWKENIRYKIRVTGIPIRKKAMIATDDRKANPDILTVLIMGGSQGAAVFARWLPAMLISLKNFSKSVRFIHLTGSQPADSVAVLYDNAGFDHRTMQFCNDMNKVYRAADLAICRAGAGTLTELAVAGIPAVVVPYPYAAENHQYYNARLYADAGAVELIEEKDCTPEILADKIMLFFKKRDTLEQMKLAMRKLAIHDAGKRIIHELKHARIL